MLKYQTHKIVEAALITEIQTRENGYSVAVEGGEHHRLTQDDGERILKMMDHRPPAELAAGYLVRYADGYVNWSPAAAFEDGYTPVQPSSGKSSIKGYRELTAGEVELINHTKEMGEALEILVANVKTHTAHGQDIAPGVGSAADQELIADEIKRQDAYRWISIGKTHLQQGLMALTRAIAKPDFF